MNGEKKDLLFGIIDKGFSFLTAAMYAVVNSTDETELQDMTAAPPRTLVSDGWHSDLPNGRYMVYADGYVEAFDGQNDKSQHGGIKYVGIVHDGHAWCLLLKSYGKHKLVRDTDDCPEERELYIDSESEALMDWECMERTKHLLETGTDIPFGEGEYLPALPMLVVMCAYRDAINETLEYAGGDILTDDGHWSVTEFNSRYAWHVGFTSGNITSSYGKYISLVARGVAAFPSQPAQRQ